MLPWPLSARIPGPRVESRIESRGDAGFRVFLDKHRAYLAGRVLDLGGPQCYRDRAPGEYVYLAEGERMPGGYFDAVICDRRLERAQRPADMLRWSCRAMLRVGGALLLAYRAANDDEPSDGLWRFTHDGMEWLLLEAGLRVAHHERNCVVALK